MERTYEAIDLARAHKGPRAPGRDEHYDLCSGFTCPCFMEGKGVAAHNHLGVLDHFCRTDPDLVRERLREHRPVGYDGFRALDCESCGGRWPCPAEVERMDHIGGGE